MMQEQIKMRDGKYAYIPFECGKSLKLKKGDIITLLVTAVNERQMKTTITLILGQSRGKFHLMMKSHTKAFKLTGDEFIQFTIVRASRETEEIYDERTEPTKIVQDA